MTAIANVLWVSGASLSHWKKKNYVQVSHVNKLKKYTWDEIRALRDIATANKSKFIWNLWDINVFEAKKQKQTFDISQFDVKDVFIDYENRKIVIRF